MKIKNKILSVKNISKISRNLKKQGKIIVFCSGCYDILHSGHIIFFEQCRKNGDVLVVAVGRDGPIKKQKGLNRPVNT